MNKRGEEILLESIFTILILVFVFAAMFFFIGQQANGKLIEKQVLAKEVCMISLASESGSSVIIEHNPGLVIEKKDNGISVNEKDGILARAYFYDCYGNFELNSIENGKTILIISRSKA